MKGLRRLTVFLLTLAITATGFGMAMSRGAMAAEAQVCSIFAPAPIVLAHDGLPLLDSQGEPVMLAHDICLDCILGAFGVGPDARPIPAPCSIARRAHAPRASDLRGPLLLIGGAGRGPPAVA